MSAKAIKDIQDARRLLTETFGEKSFTFDARSGAVKKIYKLLVKAEGNIIISTK